MFPRGEGPLWGSESARPPLNGPWGPALGPTFPCLPGVSAPTRGQRHTGKAVLCREEAPGACMVDTRLHPSVRMG